MIVSEIFKSIQGESSYAGLPCVFIRLAGCNLKCTWCDTPYARVPEGALELTVEEIVDKARFFDCRLVEITGGEPLLQKDTGRLARAFLDDGFSVLVETNGSISLDGLDGRVVKIVDVKCPSSGHGGSFLMENLNFITPEDEIKFVIGDKADYEYARMFLEECLKDRTAKVLFAPVRPALDPKELAGWILKDCLSVRLQLQIHSYIWPGERGR